MALITETGAGLAGAESFASVADADAYWAIRGAPAAWTALTTGDKEAALRLGTEYLGQRFAERWKGYRVSTTQALDWPRVGVVVDRFERVYTVIPVELVRATIELALKSRTASLTADEAAQVKSEAVGPIAVTYADNARQQTRFAAVENMLHPLLTGSGSISIVRA
ncbi:MAG: hypothetical protein EOP39_04590 [Rubrivivax sp.]|nr:MAG: hypothetical protein EOP39_04590 [Rubrivivax sp.]